MNLFAGSLIINIITIGYTTRVPSFSFTGFTLVINLAEIVNIVITKPANMVKTVDGEWFNGKTAAFKVADLGSNPLIETAH